MSGLAILADIHGNSWALAAVLADLSRRGDPPMVNLGDVFYGPLDPAGTASLLRDREIPTLSGNQDRVLWQPEGGIEVTPTYRDVRRALSATDLGWLRSLPGHLVLGEVFCCHGTPAKDDEYLLEAVGPEGVSLRGSQSILAELREVEQSVVLCGHSHVPRIVELPDGPLVVNPGSVGLPAYTDDRPYPHAMESGSPRARYAWLEEGAWGWRVEMVAVPYDWRAAADKAETSGRGDWAGWIATGRGFQ